MEKIVIVGAGYSGILAAKKLSKKLKDSNNYEITIIDKNSFHTMLTELHEVAAWRVEEDSIRISLSKVFQGRNVKVVTDTVNSIDYTGKSVKCNNASYKYDYLILASGSKPAFFGVPGAKEHTFTLWSYEDAVRLREHIVEVFRKASNESNKEKRRKLLSFVTVGAGFTGVEMAGELAELVPSLCVRFEIDKSDVSMYDVDMLDRCCTVLPEKLSMKVQRRLEKMNVNVLLKSSIKAVGEDYIEYEANGKKAKLNASTVIWTAGVEGADIAFEAESIGKAGRGRVQTDEYLRSINDKRVYIAGDNIFYIPEGEEHPVPQMVENAEASAELIAHNIITQITGKGELEKYHPKFHGVMVCIGGRYGVAHIGSANKKIALPSFLAMFTKHFVNILYFINVLGLNKILSYIKHEFFVVKHKRSFVGGHFANRSITAFLVPLRVFLGGYWIFEGIKKINEGWFTETKLAAFFQGANAFYENLLSWAAGEVIAATDAVSAATDAVSAATGAAGEAAASAGEVLINFNFLSIFKVIFVNSGDYALKIDVPFMNWMMDRFILPSEGMQNFFQISIVLAEIAIGLALVGGLFTTLAGAASVMLQMMFLTSTGLYLATWWMIFAGVAMMFGAGRVLSLDYYVMPCLKKWWKNTKLAKKWYLYND